MRDKAEKIYKEIDALITSGKVHEARVKLSKLRRTELSPSFRAKIASLARRADLPQIALILLRPTVRPAGGQMSHATDEEKSEYAASLADLGAGIEALKLLSEVNKQRYPQGLLHTAFAYFSQWDYASAIPVLEQFVSHPDITAQQRVVGRINLAASLVHENQETAGPLLKELLEENIKSKYVLAEAYVRMLYAEFKIFHHEWDKAREHLKRSEAVYAASQSVEGLFVRKWMAILNMYAEAHNGKEAKALLENVRKEAREKKHWETLRDCDFHEAVFSKNEDLFLRVYFGTSYPAQKAHLLKDYKNNVNVPDTYLWASHVKEASPSDKVDVLLDGSEKALPRGQAPYRLFFSLCSDFYRPLRIAELHSSAYPGEYFNPLSSPARVHQGICRLRKWMKECKIPISIGEQDGGYQIDINETRASILIPNAQMATSRSEGGIFKLKEKLGESAQFTLKEAQEVLGGSYWSVNRLIKQAEERGLIAKLSHGRNMRYCFVLNSKEKAA